MNHTFLSIANECSVKKDAVKYAYRKLGVELGEVVEGTRRFNDSERKQIVESGKFDPAAIVLATEVVPEENPVDSVDLIVCDITPIEYEATAEDPLLDRIGAGLSRIQQQSNANANKGLAVLFANKQRSGRKLGAALAQAEIGAAIKERDRLIGEFLEGEGVAATPG